MHALAHSASNLLPPLPPPPPLHPRRKDSPDASDVHASRRTTVGLPRRVEQLACVAVEAGPALARSVDARAVVATPGWAGARPRSGALCGGGGLAAVARPLARTTDGVPLPPVVAHAWSVAWQGLAAGDGRVALAVSTASTVQLAKAARETRVAAANVRVEALCGPHRQVGGRRMQAGGKVINHTTLILQTK